MEKKAEISIEVLTKSNPVNSVFGYLYFFLIFQMKIIHKPYFLTLMYEALQKLKNIPFSELDQAPPFTKWLNGVLKDIQPDGSLEMTFEIREEMCNPVGVLHGGIHSAILDDLIGFGVTMLQLDKLYLSVNLSVDFLGKAVKGEVVTAKSRIIRKGNTMINAEAKLYGEKGHLISKASSNLANTGRVFEGEITFK